MEKGGESLIYIIHTSGTLTHCCIPVYTMTQSKRFFRRVEISMDKHNHQEQINVGPIFFQVIKFLSIKKIGKARVRTKKIIDLHKCQTPFTAPKKEEDKKWQYFGYCLLFSSVFGARIQKPNM
ncbi:hypothetical protein CIPAW_13G064300 [Carya illinoinensis]|uniref:Uncharacterized protein n=1 Tax=Carya illinoinensis TaxID=32201 RepID=A0A8T1NNB5_CARIL|nr:hypothetical protein CIPAW_13G064300 [Carya illinoinensis]